MFSALTITSEVKVADFNNRVFIVTGGAQGIGRSIVEYLYSKNGIIIVADIDCEAGNELTEDLNSPERIIFLETDVGSEPSVCNCIEYTVNRFNHIDGIVNNAGISKPGNIPIEDLDLTTWDKMIRTNLTGSFLMAKHASPHMSSGTASIVNIASTRAVQSEANTEAYSASKGGLVAITHAMAVSFSHRIRVNVILPGWIDVSASKKRSSRQAVNLSRADHLQHPAGRVGVPDDISSLTGFLLSDAAGFITGQSFVVDGGMTKKMMYVE